MPECRSLCFWAVISFREVSSSLELGKYSDYRCWIGEGIEMLPVLYVDFSSIAVFLVPHHILTLGFLSLESL